MGSSDDSKVSLDPETFARYDFLPRHDGATVLPHDLVFHDLYSLAVSQRHIMIRDMNTGHAASHQQFLSDVVALRKKLMDDLHPETLGALRDEREVSLLILSEGYESMVAFFAIFALGGIAVPLSPHITLPEAVHNCNTVRAHAIVSSSKYLSIANELGKRSRIGGERFRSIMSTPFLLTPIIEMSSLTFSSGRVPDQNKPCVVIFTSGSTGPPKGVAIRRYNIYAGARFIQRAQNVDCSTTVAQFMPTHHASGLLFNTLPIILGGGCVEFCQGGFDSAKVWQRFRDGGLPSFSAVPTVYIRLLRYWETVISTLPAEERDTYRSAVSGIGSFYCGTAALPRQVFEQWFDLTGKHITERYGGSEMSNVYANLPGDAVVPGSVGVKNPRVESKLSEGNHGEVLVRSPFVFTKYMNDPEATRKAFDEDGFYKTGDVARREGKHYFIEGRSSVDILKSGGYKISALDVEQEILRHPKVAEAVVLGVDDDEFGQRVAAAVVLRDPAETLTLKELRGGLRSRLSNYKLPSLLRVVSELRQTETYKVPKALLKHELFPPGHPEVQQWTSPDGVQMAVSKL